MVQTNSFEGHGIYSLITDNDLDKIEDPVSTNDLTDLWFNGQRMISCNGCGALYLWNQENLGYDKYEKSQ